jgi:hypothetical protein
MERIKYQYERMVCNQQDDEIFVRQCKALEANIPGLVKGELIQVLDLDRQKYMLNGKSVVVENDALVGGVFVRSDVDLLPYFQQKQQRRSKAA